ncbi:Peptide-O-fucosyltransferase [Zostera marina]|uniref:O-fucosyltransferase family protein n=1 Tax=Zostera marina TaxID=29655 RepID=A0A0K9NZK6_ZOSMR|nr:Peptide-O-fucosyltransferase [Zostera marina]
MAVKKIVFIKIKSASLFSIPSYILGCLAATLLLLLPAFCPYLFMPFCRQEYNVLKPRYSTLLKGALQRDKLIEDIDLWAPLPVSGWQHCKQSSNLAFPRSSRGYIQVFLNGGLNQQRMGICDAVAVASLLNATLVIPYLEQNSVWKDPSSFEEIFDIDHFINTLKDDVLIARELPPEYNWSTRKYYATTIRSTRIKTAPVHASANWYLENVLPVLESHGIAAISPFSHRLAFDKMPEEIQLLRCKVNFKALEFVPHIKQLGDTIVKRLRTPLPLHISENNPQLSDDMSTGKYVALHLRFDKDMAAYSSCDFGGGKAETLALAKYRQLIWQGRVRNSQFTDQELRRKGRCPLTPEEVGLFLAALGFDTTTRLYLASHKVYGGESRLSTLQAIFPLMEDKRSLASNVELARVNGRASLLAAVDYYVSSQSDIFVSASPGNMHNALVGYRTYENLKTIRADMALLGRVFLNKTMKWDDFEETVHDGHLYRYGSEIRLKKPNQSIYAYPAPDCLCPSPL